MASPQRIGSSGTKVLSSVILALGVLIVIRTLAAGGGPASLGVLLGVIFAAIGGGRLYLAMRRPA
ncbi:MAG TPA: hypothetical protein VJS87_02040 [Solirubrobacterales bacterium]|jgi:hypothetical protein|nr:hypothetical protein [Solirubrobacterales bacterium]HKQ17298.1 hypothetical protein [Solirubrobacterales bacterium]